MSDADKAYAAALKEIERVKASGETEISFDNKPYHALQKIPPEITDLKNLKTLDINQTQVSDLSPLTGMTALQTLLLNRTQVSDLSPLTGMTALQALILDQTQVSDLSPLTGMTALQVLTLNQTQVSDLSPLTGMTALHRLYLNQTQVRDLSPLTGMTALQTLLLNQTQVRDLSPLTGMTALHTLWFDQTQVSDLSPLTGMTALQGLRFNQTQVSDLSPLTGMTALQALILNQTQVSDLSPLTGMTALQVLQLNQTQVSDLSPLTGMTALRALHLNQTQVSDLRPVRALPKLGERHSGGLQYAATPATEASSELARLSEIKDDTTRTNETLAFLQALPTLEIKTDHIPNREDIEVYREEVARLLKSIGENDDAVSSARHNIDSLNKAIESTKDQLKDFETQTAARIESANEGFSKSMQAAEAAFNADLALKTPVTLWETKQKTHEANRKHAFRLFISGLIVVAAAVVSLLFVLTNFPTWVDILLCSSTSPASDLSSIGGLPSTSVTSSCSGFGLRGLIVTASTLTLLTVLLWFTRLQMKLFLAERHLVLDAMERQAFAQSYLGFLKEGDTSSEAQDQRAIVYAALFRPSSDGTIKEDGGMDPAITAALSKLLSK